MYLLSLLTFQITETSFVFFKDDLRNIAFRVTAELDQHAMALQG